ncbi:MAG: tautomerase family protein [Fibrobacteraceae bacterium]|nr:tautomerase family protein [Fibrobacteraceae bacterium]
MPHVTIQMYPGRDDALKAKAAQSVTEALVKSLGISKETLSVSVEDVPQAEWGAKVLAYREGGNKKLFVSKGDVL